MDHKKALLAGGLIGLIASDIIPTPADAAYFLIQKKLIDKRERGEITPEQYWTREALAYYGLNPIWWGLVAVVTLSIKGGVKNQLYVAGSIIASGAVVGVIYRNIRKDNQERLYLQSKTPPPAYSLGA